jgi:hypothetical protein
VVAPTSNAPGVKEVDVCGVVLRAATNYRTFEIARKDVPMWAGDIIKTAPDTSMAVELLIGARVGVKRGSTVMIGSDGETAFTEVSEGQWRKITLNSGGVYAKFNKHEKPLTIQTRGGVMGIKG